VNPPNRKPLVYLITSGLLTDQNYHQLSAETVELISEAADLGVQLVQIREKSISAGKAYDLACRAVSASARSDAKILVNDRADIALSAGCAGVHLTSNSVPASLVRRHFGSRFIIGVSTHTVGELESAAREQADFAVFGPVFDTPGKGPAKGLDELRSAVESVRPFPVLALGGINEKNAASMIEAGAAGLAAIRMLNDRESLRRIAAMFEL
jgi:thiamine-phosphate pyrophosphorylase